MMTATPPINARFPLIVVKRAYFEQFEEGTKTVEYRLHRKPFTRHAFYPGRFVRLAYNYDIKRYPSLIARIVTFEVLRVEQLRASEHIDLTRHYPDLRASDEIALIALDVLR
jgi:hypothetical protein